MSTNNKLFDTDNPSKPAPADTDLLALGDSENPTGGGFPLKTTTVSELLAKASSGFPSVKASGRQTGQTASIASLAAYTVGASDGSFQISGNVLVTAISGTLGMFVAWTDEGGNSHSVQMFFTYQGLGSILITLTSMNDFIGLSFGIRAKAGTTITVSTLILGGSATCNAEAYITQLG